MISKEKSTPKYMQYYSAVSGTMSLACATLYGAWLSPTLPRLSSDDSPIGVTVTLEEESWIAAAAFLPAIFGSLSGAVLIDKYGPRRCMLACAIPYIVGWFLVIFANSAAVLIAAACLTGLGGGLAYVSAPLYIGEIADKSIRGKLGVLGGIFVNALQFLILGIGPFISYTALAIVCCFWPILFVAMFYFTPESPYYLVKIGRRDAAKCSLIRLNGNDADGKTINDRLLEIEETIQYDCKNATTLTELVSKRNYRKSLLIMIVLKLVRAFNGVSPMGVYKQSTIELTNSSVSPGVSSIIFGFVDIIAIIFCALLVDKTGRKSLLVVTAFGSAIAIATEGVYFYLRELEVNTRQIEWLPTTALATYLFLSSMGLNTLLNVLMAELFATNIKGTAAAVFTSFAAVLNFTALKFYAPLADTWGTYVMFWIFAGVSVLGGIFILLVLPETRGKSFMDIQKKLNK